MIRHILCPVDHSQAAEHAVEQAAAVGASVGARLTLLHVVPPLQMAFPDGTTALLTELRPQDEQQIRVWMDEYRRVAEQRGVTTELAIVTGRPDDAIVAHAATSGVDLIVMATHGYAGMKHLLLGSVTERVLRQASCPVLTVPPHAEAVRRGPFTRVLCPIDFSDCSLRALEFAMTTAQTRGAELLLAHVLEWPWPEPPAPNFDDLPAQEAAALTRFRTQREEGALRRLVTLEPEGWHDRCRSLVLHGTPHVALLQFAADRQVDAIVLGITGRNAVDLAVFGSTTNHIIRRAECPVITVKA